MAELNGKQKRARALQLQLTLSYGGKASQPAPSRNPDGTYGEPPEGAFTDPKTGQMIDPTQRAEYDERVIAARPVAARAGEFVQGAPFVGEFIDEAVETFDPEAAYRMRETSDAMERQRPGQSMALNIAGGITAALPLAAAGPGSKAADFVARGGNKLTRAVRGMAVAAPAGAVEGAATMAGRARDGERVEAGKAGAVIGAGLGGALGAFAPMFGEGVAAIAKRVKKLDVKTIADSLGVSLPAARVIKSAIQNDDINKVTQTLAAKGDDALLAESGAATRNLLDSSMATGGAALRTGRDAVDERIQLVAPRVVKTFDNVLGKPGGLRAANRGINKGTQKARAAAYKEAFAQPTPMTGDAARQINSVLARVDPADFDSAMKEANAIMRNDGLTNPNFMASIADDGTVTFSQPPSVLQLDALARGLYEVADKGTDSMTGQMTSGARRAADQAKSLRDAMKNSVKGYGRALKLGGDTIKAREALKTGKGILRATTSKEDVREVMADANALTKQAIRTGIRENIDDVMGRARSTIQDLESGAVDFETGTNAVGEAVAAVSNIMQPENVTKLRMALGPADAKKITDQLSQMADVMVLRSAVARNSATAIRQATQGQMRAEATPGLVRRVAGEGGNPFDALREITRSAAGTDARAMSEAIEQNAAEIADALTRIKGPEARRALSAIRRAMAGQPMKDAEAQLIGRVVSGSAGVAGYRGAQQSLTPR